MADGFLRVNAAAELALNSDSDESLLENESDAEDIDDMDISDESSDTDDAPSTLQCKVPLCPKTCFSVYHSRKSFC